MCVCFSLAPFFFSCFERLLMGVCDNGRGGGKMGEVEERGEGVVR